MSFGFSIGDFLTVIEGANDIRTKFIGAPAQFRALSDKVRNLTIVVNDVKIDLSNTALSSEQETELQEIAASCRNVLAEIEKTIERYSAINGPHGFKRVWKRLKWEPEDIRDLRNRLCSNIGLLNAINGRITRDGVLELLEHKTNEQDKKCLEWLSPMNYAVQQSDFISRRQPGTGEWLLESPEFLEWIERPQEILFCPGIPGAGKTILASVVVDELATRFENDYGVGIAYLFCSFEHHADQIQKPENLLASILRQLAQGLVSMPDSIVALYDKHKTKGTRLSFNETSKALRSVFSHLSRVFIVVDALDECESLARSRILDEIFNLQMTNNLNLLVTSRFIPEVMTRFQNKLTREIRAAKPDVMAYLNANLERLPSFVSRNQQLQQKITEEITDAVGGMFLLAQLHLDSLRGKRSERAIRRELEELVRGSNSYDSAYDKTMQRIEGQIPDRRNMALEVLSWITCARRPLTTLELLHALAVELGESEFHEDNLPDLDDIISACAGLITITADPTGDTIRLVHYTAKEYFERTWTSWFSNAHNNIATTCVTYLTFDVFQRGMCFTDAEFEAQLDQYPLYSYAAKGWGHHARTQPINEELLMGFLGDTGKVDACVQGIFTLGGSSSHGDYSPPVSLGFTGLHLAAYFGLESVVRSMIAHCDQSHVGDAKGRTPFIWAVYAGHGEVAKLFLENGVNAHGQDWDGRTPISLAASGGWVDIVKLLLDHHVDPDSRDIDDQTPLSWAAYRGHSEIARLLVKRGANPDSKDEYGKRPLSWAAADGWAEIVHFLLEQSVDIDFQDGVGRTPVSWAAENGHVAVVRLLLEKGAQPDSKDAEGRTPSFWAAHYGHEAVLQFLLMRSVNPGPWFPVMNSVGSAFQSTEHPLPCMLPITPSPGYKMPFDQNEPTRGSEFRCPLCTGGFLSYGRRAFRHHLNNQHYPQWDFRCAEPSCGRRFRRLDKARSHYGWHGMTPSQGALNIIRKEEPPPSNCPVCQRHVKSWSEFHECVLNHAQDSSSPNKVSQIPSLEEKGQKIDGTTGP